MTAGDVLAGLREAPLADFGEVLPGRFLVLAPHPDDESLGCGGLIAEACRRGRPPVVAILTDGGFSHPNSAEYPPGRMAAVRQEETRRAVSYLGLPASNLHFLGASDGAAPSAGPEAELLARQVVALARGCDAILVTWRHDPHCDHEAAWAIAAMAAREAGLRLLEYPVWGWTLDRYRVLFGLAGSAWRIPISPHLPAKRQAIAAHASQHGDLITDDPDGFVLPAGFLALFDTPWETLLEGGP